MTDIIQYAKQLAELEVPHLRAEIIVHEDEDPRYADDCLVRIVEKDDESNIWYEEEHGGYEYDRLHDANVFAAAPELAQALAEETWEYRYERKLIYQTDEWVPMGDWHRWYSTPELAKSAASRYPNALPVRLTRRRVSPPVVINE